MPQPQVESYRFGQMAVDGEKHTNDLILLPDRVIPNWWRGQGHRLSTDDLEDVFEAQPEVLVVGTGGNGVMDVPRRTRQAVEEASIEFKVVQTGEAWQMYNDLHERRETAGVFHLTC